MDDFFYNEGFVMDFGTESLYYGIENEWEEELMEFSEEYVELEVLEERGDALINDERETWFEQDKKDEEIVEIEEQKSDSTLEIIELKQKENEEKDTIIERIIKNLLRIIIGLKI